MLGKCLDKYLMGKDWFALRAVIHDIVCLMTFIYYLLRCRQYKIFLQKDKMT